MNVTSTHKVHTVTVGPSQFDMTGCWGGTDVNILWHFVQTYDAGTLVIVKNGKWMQNKAKILLCLSMTL